MGSENNYTVYIHTSPSHKAYIGITSTNVEERWDNGNGYLKKRKDGKYKQPAMANAILKYGWESFDHIIFASCLSKEDAEHMEKLLIEIFQTRNKLYGYNIREGGGSVGKMAEESRLKMIESLKGRKHTKEELRKMSEAHKGANNPNYGKHPSAETRQKMSTSQKARWTVDERQKVADRFQGKKKPEQGVRASADKHKKRVVCVELNKEFDSLKSAAQELGISYTNISSVLHGRKESAGKHPIIGVPLHWHYA